MESNVFVRVAVQCFKTKGVASTTAVMHACTCAFAVCSHLNPTCINLSTKRRDAGVPVFFFIWNIYSELWDHDLGYISHSTFPTLTCSTHILWAFAFLWLKGFTSFPCSFPVLLSHHKPARRERRTFAPGHDDPHWSFTQPAATSATKQGAHEQPEGLSLHKPKPFISLTPLHSWRSLMVQVEQQRLSYSIPVSCSPWQFGITLRLCQGECQQGPCPDKDITGSVLNVWDEDPLMLLSLWNRASDMLLYTVQLGLHQFGGAGNPVGHSSIDGNVWFGGIRGMKLRE